MTPTIEVLPPGKRVDLNQGRQASIIGLSKLVPWSAKWLYELRKRLLTGIDPETLGAEITAPWQIELIRRLGNLHGFTIEELTTNYGAVLMPSLWRFYQRRGLSDYEYWALHKAATHSKNPDLIREYLAMKPEDFYIDLYLMEIKSAYTTEQAIKTAKTITAA